MRASDIGGEWHRLPLLAVPQQGIGGSASVDNINQQKAVHDIWYSGVFVQPSTHYAQDTRFETESMQFVSPLLGERI